ncbi:MAG: hypothetical protein VXW38_15055 [Bacteroidota bacterium]|nr:hypothetical protein [Bacteroidota bacterium]
MNRIRIFLLVYVSFSITFLSCDADDSAETESKAPYIRFSIATSNYDFEDITTSGEALTTISGTNGLTVAQEGYAKLVLHAPGDLSIGNFSLSAGDFVYDGSSNGDLYKVELYEDSLGFYNDFAESGTISITKIDNEFVEGTFNATVSNGEGSTINISNGRFLAVYIR